MGMTVEFKYAVGDIVTTRDCILDAAGARADVVVRVFVVKQASVSENNIHTYIIGDSRNTFTRTEPEEKLIRQRDIKKTLLKTLVGRIEKFSDMNF